MFKQDGILIIELDAKLDVDLLKKDEGHSHTFDALISGCKTSLREILMVQIQHCYWELRFPRILLFPQNPRGCFVVNQFRLYQGVLRSLIFTFFCSLVSNESLILIQKKMIYHVSSVYTHDPSLKLKKHGPSCEKLVCYIIIEVTLVNGYFFLEQ